MTKIVLITDLDHTLIDSRALDDLRRQKRWRDCVNLLDGAPPFANIVEATRRLRAGGAMIGVVTNSVSFYAETALRVHAIEFDKLVAWHCTQRHKPFPDPIQLAFERLNVPQGTPSFGLGDSKDDLLAYKSMGLATLGAGWSPELVVDAGWDEILKDPLDLLRMID